MIRVLIEHDELWEKNWLSRHICVRNGFVLIRSEGRSEEVLFECEKVAPCVLIASLGLVCETNLMRFAERVEDSHLVRVIAMGPRQHSTTIERLLRLGCMGFLADDVAPGVLKKAVRSVASGELWASRKTISGMLTQLLVQASCNNQLTKRELEILKLIGEGLTNRSIADTLCISRETVRWHIRSLYSKTGVRDRLHAALYAKRVITPDEADPKALLGQSLDSTEYATEHSAASAPKG